ncbi:MAG: hypothetical protein K2X29_04390 [Candidatus Obscuribacterales bacterium]|nr:hypothetical protein [Candidatus Obscuribacterales bacterium]
MNQLHALVASSMFILNQIIKKTTMLFCASAHAVAVLVCVAFVPIQQSAFAGETANVSAANVSDSFNESNDPKAALITSRKKDTWINCTFGQVRIKKGSVVCAFDYGRDLVIYNLDSKQGWVSVLLPTNRSITVDVGQELLLTRAPKGSFEEIHPATQISYRKPSEVRVGGGVRGFIAEFSVASAMSALPPLRAKLHSTASKDKAIAQSVLKSGSILQVVTGSHGPYTPQK